MIAYHEKKPGTITVKLDGRVVGEIRAAVSGHYYVPKGSRVGGEVFNTIEEVKDSLEGR